jgi:hypothetical protein
MVCRLNIQCRLGEAFSYAVTDYFSGAVSLPVAEPLAAWMDAAKAPAGMDSPCPASGKGAAPSTSEFCLLRSQGSEDGHAKGASRRLLR